VGGVIRDPEGPSDDLGDPRQGPEIGAEPVCGGAFQQQPEESRSLPGPQPWWPAGGWLGSKGVRPASLHLGTPPADRHRGAAHLPGNLAHPEPRFEEGDGPAPPRFQVWGAAVWSHT